MIVDWRDVLGTRREHDVALELGAKRNGVARSGTSGHKLEDAVGGNRNLHEDIDRLRHFDVIVAKARHDLLQVFLARRVPAVGPEQLVAGRIAGRHQHVVLPERGVLEERQDRAAPVGNEWLTDSREEAAVEDTGVLGAGVLTDVRSAKGKQVAALLALEIDTTKPRARRKTDTAALFRRDSDPLRNDQPWATAAVVVLRSTMLPGVTSSAALLCAKPMADLTSLVTARVIATPMTYSAPARIQAKSGAGPR